MTIFIFSTTWYIVLEPKVWSFYSESGTSDFGKELRINFGFCKDIWNMSLSVENRYFYESELFTNMTKHLSKS